MAPQLLDEYADATSSQERRAPARPALRQAGRIKRLATDLLDLRRVEGGQPVHEASFGACMATCRHVEPGDPLIG
jgi:hypothetical protein